MMEVALEVFRAFALTASEKKTETDLVHASTVHIADDYAGRSDQANLKPHAILHLPRGSLAEYLDMYAGIARWTLTE